MSQVVTCNPSEAVFLALASDGKLSEMQALYSTGKVNINCVDEKGDHALLKAVRVGAKGVVSWLIASRCDVNKPSKVGSSALIAAGMQGHTDIAAMLIAHGANLNGRTDGLDSAVSLAIWKNHTDCALLLIAQNALVDTQDKFGDCPLHDSAKHGNVKVMAPLIQRLPHRISAKNAKGHTPLHCAAMHGHADAVRLLLAHSADPTVCDDEKKTPFDHCSGGADSEVGKLLAPNHLKQIGEVLADMKLKFEDKSGDEATPQYRFLLVKPLPIELQEIKLQISRKTSLIVYSSCAQRVPQPHRARCAELLARMNFDSVTGSNLELDMRDGEVRYKSSFGFGASGKVTDVKEMVRFFVSEHTTLYEPYVAAVLELVKQPNATPKEIYQQFKKKNGL